MAAGASKDETSSQETPIAMHPLISRCSLVRAASGALIACAAAALPALAQPGPAPWRAGELLVDPQAGRLDDRVTRACAGTAGVDCQPLQCRWQDDAGAHQLVYGGGASARYTDPQGHGRLLALARSEACRDCRAQYLRLHWRDPSGDEGRTLFMQWSGLEFQRGGEGHMGGFASWPNQQPRPMTCSTR